MKTKVSILIAAGICGLIGGAMVEFLVGNVAAHGGTVAPAPGRVRDRGIAGEAARYRAHPVPPIDAPARIAAKSFGVARGKTWAAELGVFGNNETKLILRDAKGRVGMVLSVPNREASGQGGRGPQIEFYNGSGELIGVIDEAMVQRLTPRVQSGMKADGHGKRKEMANLWDWVYKLDGEVEALQKAIR